MADATASSAPTATSSPSSSGNDNTATVLGYTALVISLVALVTTILQVLQQYFTSAEGYTRCARGVMGDWAKGTKRKFRWHELRFQVVFCTPVIFLAEPGNINGPLGGVPVDVDGTTNLYTNTKLENRTPVVEANIRISTANDDERASWVILLEALQKEEREGARWETNNRTTRVLRVKYDPPNHTIVHQIQQKTRSYDFMPPSITKPYATTTISHLVEMVGLLGMYWKAFEDVRGNIRAEGNGYILTSTLAQGLGLLCTFSVTGKSKFEDRRVIPSHDIKELVFGCVPYIFAGIPGINSVVRTKTTMGLIPNGVTAPLRKTYGILDIGNVERVKKTMESLRFDQGIIDLYPRIKDRKNMFSVTFEFLGMVTDTIRLRNSNLRMIPNPTADLWVGDASVIFWPDEMRQYQVGLKELVEREPQAADHEMLRTITDHWGRMLPVWIKNVDLDMREMIHNAIDDVTDQLSDEKTFSSIDAIHIVEKHIGIVLDKDEDLQKAVNVRNEVGALRGNLMKYYFSTVLPKIMGDRTATPDARNQRMVIWLGLMFRMICWFLLHDFDKQDVNRMDSVLKGSRLPVFIG